MHMDHRQVSHNSRCWHKERQNRAAAGSQPMPQQFGHRYNALPTYQSTQGSKNTRRSSTIVRAANQNRTKVTLTLAFLNLKLNPRSFPVGGYRRAGAAIMARGSKPGFTVSCLRWVERWLPVLLHGDKVLQPVPLLQVLLAGMQCHTGPGRPGHAR